MTEHQRPIARTLSLLALIISLAVAISVPVGYYAIIYQYASGSVNAEAALSARSVEKLVNSNPSSWRYEEIRLQELLEQRLKRDNPEIRVVRDLKGQIIAHVTEKISKPVMTARETIYDAGTPVGYMEIKRSVYPLLIRTSAVGLLSAGFGFLIFVIFRSIPLGALRRAHLTLEENEERLKLAVASGHLGVMDWDMGKNFMMWDDGMHEIFGIPKGSEKITFETWNSAIHPEDRDRVREEIRISSLRGGGYEDDFRVVRQDGQTRTIKSYGTIVKGADEKSSSIICLYNDVTYQREAEQAIAANRAKTQFLANMSHEIRTPMNGILGMLDMLIHSHLDKDQKRFANTAYSSANILLSILNDILDLSKIEAGKIELEIIDFDIQDALNDVANLFSARINTKLLSLRIEVDDQMTTAVQGDPVRFRQVLTNLIGNAVKFTDAGEIVVRAIRLEQDNKTLFFRFEVSDTGVGIDDKAKKRIFDSFTQADASTTRRYGGTGLGLAISRELVVLMGGTIGVESMPGKGSTFWFTVRFKRSYATPIKKSSSLSNTINDRDLTNISQAVTSQGPQQTQEIRSGQRVLLAEDNLVNQEVISAMLSHLHVTIDIVNNGKEAIEVLARQPYDLVLMDCQMPELDGYEATKRLRDLESKSQTSRTPVIALTANAMQGDREKCLSAGMDDYLAKPFNIEQLNSLLNRWMGVHTNSTLASSDRPETIVAVGIGETKPGERGQGSSPGCFGNGTGEVSTRGANAMKAEQLNGENLLTPAKNGCATDDNGDGASTLQGQTEHGETESRGPVIDMSVLDSIRALQREGTPSLVGKLVTIYVTEASAIIIDLSSAVNEKNTQDVFRLAHKLKSSSANVGALHLSSQLKSLEALGRQSEIEGTTDLFAAIEEEFKAVRTTLEKLL